MAKKKLAIGVASAVAAGAGAAILLKKKSDVESHNFFLKKVFPNLPTIGHRTRQA